MAGDTGDGWGLWETMAGRAGCGTGLRGSRSCPAALCWFWERRGNARGCPRANRQLGHLPAQSQHPEQQLPALWHWRGAVVPVPRAAGLALPEHTSCPDLGFLLLEISWLSCSPRPDTTPRLNWCLPGAAWDMQKPHATKSPVTWGPRSCLSEPWRGHKSPTQGMCCSRAEGNHSWAHLEVPG